MIELLYVIEACNQRESQPHLQLSKARDQIAGGLLVTVSGYENLALYSGRAMVVVCNCTKVFMKPSASHVPPLFLLHMVCM